jgi:hypothetical protein
VSLVNPEPGAIPRYLWDVASENIVAILEEVSADQAAINSAYAFRVEQDLFRPTIEDITATNQLVICNI